MLCKEPNEVKPNLKEGWVDFLDTLVMKFTLVLWYCVNNDCIVGLFRTGGVVVEAPTNMRL
jgi:hypothetical protein